MPTEHSATPRFDRPPLVEVACGLEHEPLVLLQAPHLGLFLRELKGFGRFTTQPQLASTDETGELTITAGDVPRTLFWSEDDQWVVQMQRDRFVVNWRKHGQHPYPGFETVTAKRHELLEVWQGFLARELGAEPPPAKRYELTYINHIPVGDRLKAVSDVGKVVPLLQGLDKRLPRLGGLKRALTELRFRPDGLAGDLRAVLNTGRSNLLDCNALLLNLVALSVVGPDNLPAPDEWYQSAHDAIVTGFCDLTSDYYQQVVWGRTADA